MYKHEDAQSVPKDPMVGAAGFEPTTSSSRTRRATRLRYAPTALTCRATEVDFSDFSAGFKWIFEWGYKPRHVEHRTVGLNTGAVAREIVETVVNPLTPA